MPSGTIWVQARDLAAGDALPRYLDTWSEWSDREAGWFAGLLDGEGCLSSSGPGESYQTLSFAQKEGLVADRARAFMRERGVAWSENEQPSGCITFKIHGSQHGVAAVLGQVRPTRLIPKFDPGGLYAAAERRDEVVAVEPAGLQEIASTTTSSGTFFSDGYGSHNSPGNGYTYASYDDWTTGAEDYAAYVKRYATTADERYGGVTNTIDECTARWVGDPLDSDDHRRYVSVLLGAINDDYEFVPGAFVEVGDEMIYAGKAQATSAMRYPVKSNTALFRGTDGALLKYASFANEGTGICRFFGPVGQPWDDAHWAWGLVMVGTSAADPAGTLCYIKDPDKKLVTFV